MGDKHKSDCAVHNAPAYEPGKCDCGVARDLLFNELVEALQELHAWSRPFIEKSPISAETHWREFPRAIKKAAAVLAKVKDEGHA